MSREFTASDSLGNFKKAHQSVGRPAVVDDMHEEYIKNPPNVRIFFSSFSQLNHFLTEPTIEHRSHLK